MAVAADLDRATDSQWDWVALTFVTATSGDDDLPPMTDEFLEAVPWTPDFGSREAVVEHIVGVMRAYAGRSELQTPLPRPSTIALADLASYRVPILGGATNHRKIMRSVREGELR